MDHLKDVVVHLEVRVDHFEDVVNHLFGVRKWLLWKCGYSFKECRAHFGHVAAHLKNL